MLRLFCLVAAVSWPVATMGVPFSGTRKPTRFYWAAIEPSSLDSAGREQAKQSIERMKQLLDTAPDDLVKADLRFRLANDYWALADSAQASGDPKESAALRAQAFRFYDQIVLEQPQFDRGDEAAYRSAVGQAVNGQREQAKKAAHNLIKQYPTSKLVPAAYLLIGDLFLDDNQVRKAEKAYEKALVDRSSRLRPFASYGDAWAALVAGDHARARQRFGELLELVPQRTPNLAPDLVALRAAALDDLVQVFAARGAVEEAFTLYSSEVSDDRRERYLADLGRASSERGKHRVAVDTYRRLIALLPTSPRAPEYQAEIVGALVKLGARDDAKLEAERFHGLYGPSGGWAQANPNGQATVERLMRDVQRLTGN